MDIDLLRAFCQLAKDKNYTLAAEHLFITQSALTKKIKRLEDNTGFALFIRGRNGAELTQAGKTLLGNASSMVHRFADFERLTKCVAKGEVGYLNIAFGISTYLQAPEWIAKFKHLYSNVHITLNDTPSSEQVAGLLDGELHLSFSRIQNFPPTLRSINLLSDQLAVAVNIQQTFDEGNVLASLSHLGYLQLRPSRGKGLTNQITEYVKSNNQSLTVSQEANDILTLLALVSANLGYTIVPLSSLTIAPKNIRLIPLEGHLANWDVGLIWNENKEDLLRDKFIDMMKLNANR